MTALPGHPALSYPWNKPGRARTAIIEFLALARREGIGDTATLDLLERLLDLRAHQLDLLKREASPKP